MWMPSSTILAQPWEEDLWERMGDEMIEEGKSCWYAFQFKISIRVQYQLQEVAKHGIPMMRMEFSTARGQL